MNQVNLTSEQQNIVDKVEFDLSNVKDQDLMYSAIRELLYNIPNNYELGTVIRKLFS